MNINPKLLKACKKGDRKAQYRLYKMCFNVLMGVCMRYQNQQEDALASLNEGFLKILNKLDLYKEEAPFEAWIRRIMINTLIDVYRKNNKVQNLMEYTDFSNNNEYYPNHFDWNEADKLYDAEELEMMIKSLPPVSQRVFNLYAIDGYKHKEIAQLLNISEGTSKWHLSSARKKLQEMLRPRVSQPKLMQHEQKN